MGQLGMVTMVAAPLVAVDLVVVTAATERAAMEVAVADPEEVA